MSPNVALRLRSVLDRVAAAEKRAGRAIGDVTLIAVSKTVSAEKVLACASAGVLNFGENYVQEAVKKIAAVKTSRPDFEIAWHFIGSLQTNKSKAVVGKFATIQSVDRFDLASALDKRAREAGVVQNILIQAKLGDEPTKAGAELDSLPELIDRVCALGNLRLEGLMSLPPIDTEPEASRKYFAQLRELRELHRSRVSGDRGSFKHLSMGTTHDFEVAIEEGATMVRVGTAVFGAREVE